jgi:hypothetical protein
MTKISGYQKLKKDNLKLLQDIYTLVMQEDFEKAFLLKMKYKNLFQLEKIVWSDDPKADPIQRSLSVYRAFIDEKDNNQGIKSIKLTDRPLPGFEFKVIKEKYVKT